MFVSDLLLLWNSNVRNYISELNVKYNASDFSYLASKAGYSDTGSFQTGSNVIHVATVAGNNTPVLDANTGLSYDDNTDRLISKDLRSLESRFIKRDDYVTAANGAAGGIPTYDLQVAGDGGQGVAYDPINNYILEWTTPQNIRITDLSNNQIEDFTVPGGVSIAMLFYDPVTQKIYGAEDTNQPVYTFKKISGTWTLINTSWYVSNEGQSLDYIFGNKIVTNGGRIREQDEATGFNIALYPYPTSTTGSIQEGFWCDIKDGTFWINSDEWYHGGITDGNRLWHVDPRKLYRKYYRTPHMDTWLDLWKLNGNQAVGRLNGQKLIGGNFSTGPVIDFGAHTGQQTLGNWTLKEGENATLEFRGSASAPSTTPEAVKDYHTLVLYDANGSNDGWGTTTPGAWQSTPTTNRYMQVRIKPLSYVAPTVIWKPTDLGALLLAWYSAIKNSGVLENEFYGLYVDTFDSSRIIQATDIVTPENSPSNVTASQRPVWSTSYMDFRGSNRHLRINTSVANWLTQVGSDCEIHVVGRKPGATNRAIYLAVTQSSTNNNRIVLQHLASTGSPANYLCIEYVDNAGVSNLMGVTDTSNGTFRMITFRLGTGGNEIFVNNVDQNITANSGSNTGQSFNLISGTTNSVYFGRIQSSTTVQGNTDMRSIMITGHLDSTQRQALVDYVTAIGEI